VGFVGGVIVGLVAEGRGVAVLGVLGFAGRVDGRLPGSIVLPAINKPACISSWLRKAMCPYDDATTRCIRRLATMWSHDVF
jgi:hypothetical protein